jgi:hypothetical protein
MSSTQANSFQKKAPEHSIVTNGDIRKNRRLQEVRKAQR